MKSKTYCPVLGDQITDIKPTTINLGGSQVHGYNIVFGNNPKTKSIFYETDLAINCAQWLGYEVTNILPQPDENYHSFELNGIHILSLHLRTYKVAKMISSHFLYK